MKQFLKKTFLLETPVFLAFVVLFFIPISVLSFNRGEIGVELSITVWTLFCIATVAACLLCVAHAMLTSAGWRMAAPTWRTLTLFCILTGFVLPLTTAAGQVEARELGVNYRNLVLALAVAGALGALSRSRLGTPLCLTAVLFVLGNAGYSFATLVRGPEAVPFSRITGISSEKNIFVISFDGLSRDITLEVLQEDTKLRDQLKDFTLYTRVIGNAPGTMMSLGFETLGGRDLKREFGTEQQIAGRLDRRTSSSAYLIQHGFDLAVYGHYNWTLGVPQRQVPWWNLQNYSVSEKLKAVDNLLAFATARTLTPKLSVPPVASGAWDTLELSIPEERLARQVRNHSGAGWDASYVTSIRDFDVLVEQLHVRTTTPVALLAHFLFTHFPVDFEKDCSYRSDDASWHKAHQNRPGFKGETICTLRKFGAFLDKLKSLGVYDRSVIVLKSDHGAPWFYHDPARVESFTIRNHPHWGYSRYAPVLAIKPIGAVHAKSPIDTRHVALSDLATTMCKIATPERDCAQFRGFDLLGKEPIPPDASYPVNIVTGPSSNFKMDTHEGVIFPRRPEFFHALTERLTSEILTSASECAVTYDLSAGQKFNNGLTGGGKWIFWRDGNQRTLKWSSPRCSPVAARIRVALKGTSQPSSPDLMAQGEGGRVRLQSDGQGFFTGDVPLAPAQRQVTLIGGGDAAAFVSLELLPRS